MDKNSQSETTRGSFMGIPAIRFDKLWVNFPERLRQSIFVNYDAYVILKDGTRAPAIVYGIEDFRKKYARRIARLMEFTANDPPAYQG